MNLSNYQDYMLYIINKHKKCFFTAPRQVGTTTALCQYLYDYSNNNPNKQICYFSNNIETSKQVFKKTLYKRNLDLDIKYDCVPLIILNNNTHINFIEKLRPDHKYLYIHKFDLVIVDNLYAFINSKEVFNNYFYNKNKYQDTKIIFTYTSDMLAYDLPNLKPDYLLSFFGNDIHFDHKTFKDIESGIFLRKFKLKQLFNE